jgi:hypothetical protein
MQLVQHHASSCMPLNKNVSDLVARCILQPMVSGKTTTSWGPNRWKANAAESELLGGCSEPLKHSCCSDSAGGTGIVTHQRKHFCSCPRHLLMMQHLTVHCHTHFPIMHKECESQKCEHNFAAWDLNSFLTGVSGVSIPYYWLIPVDPYFTASDNKTKKKYIIFHTVLVQQDD